MKKTVGAGLLLILGACSTVPDMPEDQSLTPHSLSNNTATDSDTTSSTAQQSSDTAIAQTKADTKPEPGKSSNKTAAVAALNDNGWSVLKQVEQERPTEVPAYRLCHIDAHNQVSDFYFEQGKSFMDGDLPPWKDGEIISSSSNPGAIQLKMRKLGAMWAVQMVFEPTQKFRCQFKGMDDACAPSWCNLAISNESNSGENADAYLDKISHAAKSVGMQVVVE
ncbi:hypothetical protein [Neptunicella marina]|uniref:Uncharacterized protein n=1 Tax=Neptunicella marina TaxID=2125989 RepID=A0A8J6ISN5_9ALTE|nr:hypothetical protein [Neptunicella marina]MBC3764683.1 hypothetical protein [Neptunicella marina]